jgi:hypothetical protein
MSFVDDSDQFYLVEKEGTYTDDAGRSTFIAAGTRIARGDAEAYGLVKARAQAKAEAAPENKAERAPERK